MGERIDLLHRRHRIIAGSGPSGPAALVYDGRTKLHEAAGRTLNEALDAARRWIDTLLDGQEASRRSSYIGTKEEYLRFFERHSIGRHHEAMLRAHANATAHTLTATELAQAAGYDGYEVANAHYGRLGRRVAEFLGLEPPIDQRRNEPVWTCALAVGAKGDSDATTHLRWTMHPELLDALRELNMT